MPLVSLHSNANPDPDVVAAVLREATAITARELGKPESVVMARAWFGVPMMFAGTIDPTLLVEIEGLGTDDAATGPLTDAFCDLGKERLAIDPARIFIKLHDIHRGRWGSGYRVF